MHTYLALELGVVEVKIVFRFSCCVTNVCNIPSLLLCFMLIAHCINLILFDLASSDVIKNSLT